MLNCQRKQFDPLVYLCQDVLIVIFAHLEPEDVRNCSYVNHAWYDRVPSLSSTPWDDYYLDAEYPIDVLKKPPARRQLMKKLSALSYGDSKMFYNHLNTVTIAWKCQNIRELSLYDCSTSNDEMDFIHNLKALGNTLRVLIIEQHASILPFFSILEACPNLYTFHYGIGSTNNSTEMLVDHDPSLSYLDHKKLKPYQEIQFENLTCLSLNCIIPSVHTKDILKSCPNLRCVRLGNVEKCPTLDSVNGDLPITNGKNTNLTSILQHCPNVEYIECNRRDDPSRDDNDNNLLCTGTSWWKNYGDKHPSLFQANSFRQSSSRSSLLRVLKFSGVEGQGYNYSDVAHILRESQGSLEVLHLANCELIRLLDGISMTRLREFHCKGWICSSARELIAFIGRCLVLRRFAVDPSHNILQNSALLANTLGQLTSLVTLEFRLFYDGVITDLTEGDVFPASTYISNLLNHLGSQETCHIRSLSFGTDREPLLLSNSMINAAASISSIRNIQLYNDCYYDEYSEDTIFDDNEEIRNDVNGHVPQITSQGVTNFLSKLQKNTKIETIHFKDIKSLSTEAYRVLGQMSTLRELHVFDCSTISKTKIRHLLEHGISQQKFKKLIIKGYNQKWYNKPVCMKYLLKTKFRFQRVIQEDDYKFEVHRFIVH